MDVGQEDWLIRYSGMELGSDAMRQELRDLNLDANVCGVVPEVRMDPGSPTLWTVKFNTGARAPADEELARRVSARRTRHLREEAMSATETALVEILQERYTDMDLSPGSVLRALISSTAIVINQLQSHSVEQARNQIVDQLTTNGLDGVPGRALDAMAQQAMEAQQGSREAIIREYISTNQGRQRLAAAMAQPIRDRVGWAARAAIPVQQLPEGALPIYDRDPEVGRMVAVHADHDDSAQLIADALPSALPSEDLVANAGKHWVGSPANPDATVEVVAAPVRTRWQRLLDDDLFG
jgi:hypothetical protein